MVNPLFVIPLIAAIGSAIGITVQKIILKHRKVDIKLYTTAEFGAIVIVMLPIIWFFWRLESQAFELTNIIVFLLVVFFSIIANLFVFYSMKWDKISNIEPARVMEPIFTILLAIGFSFIFGQGLYERNLNIIVPALIAGAALILSHIKKHHLRFNKYFIFAIIGSFFFALELVISKLILDHYSAITFYFLRCLTIFIISFLIFQPKFSKLKGKAEWEVLSLGVIWVICRVLIYYGYQKIGVALTTLLFMIGPILVFVFAWKFLKEKIDWRNIIAAIIIIACILYAVVF